MNGPRIYSTLYNALRIFHWGLFVIAVEVFFTIAGWMLCGLLGIFIAAVLNFVLGLDYSEQIWQLFPAAGKILGALSGLLFIRFIFARFIKR